jgi:site-specific DNA-methyltransferase (adenine-specific)
MMGSGSSRIAAYKLGYDYWGCELDKEYFDKASERFEKECNGITRLPDGTKIKQLSIFDDYGDNNDFTPRSDKHCDELLP